MSRFVTAQLPSDVRADLAPRRARTRRTFLLGAIALSALLWTAAPAHAQCCFCGGCVPSGEFCTETPLDTVACATLCTNSNCNGTVIFDNLDSCTNGCGPLDVQKKEKCRAAKLKVAGKYAYCRLKEDRKAAMSGNPADYARCDSRLQDGFAQAESASGGNCYATTDATLIQTFIATLTDEVDDSLAGGGPPTCP